MPQTRITLRRIGEPYYFEATNATGNTVHLDAGASVGGTGKGARPMELLLMGLAGCSGIDVVNILRKQKHEIAAFDIEVVGARGDSAGANPFTEIHINFILKGVIDEDHLKRAIELSIEKYCSAAAMIEKTAKIKWDYSLNA